MSASTALWQYLKTSPTIGRTKCFYWQSSSQISSIQSTSSLPLWRGSASNAWTASAFPPRAQQMSCAPWCWRALVELAAHPDGHQVRNGGKHLQSSWGSCFLHCHGGRRLSAPWKPDRKLSSTHPTPAAQRHTGRGQACDHPWPQRSSTGTPVAPWRPACTHSSGNSHQTWNGSQRDTKPMCSPDPKHRKIHPKKDLFAGPEGVHDWSFAWTGPSTSLHQPPAYHRSRGHSPPSRTSCATCQWKQGSVGDTRMHVSSCLLGCWRQTPKQYLLPEGCGKRRVIEMVSVPT